MPRLFRVGVFFAVLGPMAAPWLAIANEYHVALTGSDANAGTTEHPFRSIQHGADVARPGDRVIVHAGVYRERVNPPRGGESERRRIVYAAAPGEVVEIAGSEQVRGWTRVNDYTWTVVLPNSRFGSFNPYRVVLKGDWFDGKGRVHHPGAVYLDGTWLAEAATIEDVLAKPTGVPVWFARVDDEHTTLWAQFGEADPNAREAEINVRQTVFYPSEPGRNYITMRGFVLRDAATPWAPPTAEQIGVIGTNWSRGWIIENNVVQHSACCGISLGKYGDEFDNTSADSAEGYVATIERARHFRIPWRGDAVGHHIVRGNTVAFCEQAGVVGSLGCAFSVVTGNTIHDIHQRRLFTGAEMAGIKFHGAIDVEITQNEIYRANRGIWLDWMAQGARVSANLFHDNGPSEDLFLEVDHGPYVVDNNVLLSPTSLLLMSEGGAFVHNLITGRVTTLPELSRETPYLRPHSTAVVGLANVRGGDDRFYNNVFVGRSDSPDTSSAWGRRIAPYSGYGLVGYDHVDGPLWAAGNAYLNGARPAARERSPSEIGQLEWSDAISPSTVPDGVGRTVKLYFPAALRRVPTVVVNSAILGRARVPDAQFENRDGSPITFGTDYFGRSRDAVRPTCGAFERVDAPVDLVVRR